MRYLLLSDIHGNWEALQAVLAAAAGQHDRIICLGDLIGYGADPNRVVDWVREAVMVTVRGNHDRACAGLEDLEWFNPVARAAAQWTHQQLTPENIEFVAALPKGPVPVDGFQVMHGSPLNEDEYMVSVSDVKPVFPYLEWPVAFFGHTHVQGGFEWVRNRVRSVGRPDPQRQEQMLLELDSDSAYLLNPGSVGQPRDGDPRAAYLVYDPDDRFLLFHRVAYDIPAAQAKILDAGLPDLLAHRLAVGR